MAKGTVKKNTRQQKKQETFFLCMMRVEKKIKKN